MTKFILKFPVPERTALKCVWTPTGNPARPLVCHWVESEPAAPARPFLVAARPQRGQVCA
jgi:hypothetical protein